jgi:GAF domain-containing protein
VRRHGSSTDLKQQLDLRTRELNEAQKKLDLRTGELSEALEQQIATSEILGVIAASPTNIKPVLEAIAENACRLCDAFDSVIFLSEDGRLRARAHHGAISILGEGPIDDRGWVTGRAFVDRAPVHVHDLQSAADEFPDGSERALRLGHRTTLGIPLLREDEAIGTLLIRRDEVRPFTDKQIALLTTFARQAVIAIENTRLFDAEQQRTRELTESLQQQTATADVLKVISRSTFDLTTVLQTLVESAAQLCDAQMTAITSPQQDTFYYVASYGFSADFQEYIKTIPHSAGRGTVVGRTLLEGKVVHIHDALADPEYQALQGQQIAGFRTLLGVPLVRERASIAVMVLARKTVGPFTQRQIELATTFADQAVIAIENARLLNELRESLQQQTATADVLKVISRSTFDLHTVLQTLVVSAAHLCRADRCAIRLVRDGSFHHLAAYGYPPKHIEYMASHPVLPNRASFVGASC